MPIAEASAAGVVAAGDVAEGPWARGKRQLTTAYAWFIAKRAQRSSWKETDEAFHTTWEKVFSAVSEGQPSDLHCQ